MSKIKAIIKRPDEKVGHVTHISDTLENLQIHVGGRIEIVNLHFCGAVMICNEEGKIGELPRNFRIWEAFPDIVRGPVIICGAEGEELGDVPFDLSVWKMLLRKWGNDID